MMQCTSTPTNHTVVSTIGALSCYTTSSLCGKALAQRWWPQRLDTFTQHVHRQRAALWTYMLLLRVTPVLPNTFINIASPIVGVPVGPFVLGMLDVHVCHWMCMSYCSVCIMQCLYSCHVHVILFRVHNSVCTVVMCILLHYRANVWCICIMYTHTGTFFGCMPNNFVAVSAGNRLGELTSLTQLYDMKMLVLGM